LKVANIYRIPLVLSLSNANRFVQNAGLLISPYGYVSVSHSAQSFFFSYASKGNKTYAIALSVYFGKMMKGARQTNGV